MMLDAPPQATTPSITATKNWRIPAEWEPQGAAVLAWPHENTDWAPRLSEAQHTFATIIHTISRNQPVILLAPDDHQSEQLVERFSHTLHPVHIQPVSYNDTWVRDSLFLTAIRACDWRALDFHFDGWGGKFEAGHDNTINRNLLQRWGLSSHLCTRPFALEGGAVDFDGAGTVLTTTACLQKRHPAPLPDLECRLKHELGIQRVLWLHHGAIAGDDTDGHVDMLARFADTASIVYQSCDEVSYPHYSALRAMTEELQQLRTLDGAPYRLHALPWPEPVYDGTGRRLPASYANFFITNTQVLVPTYECPQDSQALDVIQAAFPGRQAIGIPCQALIWQNGSLHCSTMQIPQLAFKHIHNALTDHGKN